MPSSFRGHLLLLVALVSSDRHFVEAWCQPGGIRNGSSSSSSRQKQKFVSRTSLFVRLVDGKIVVDDESDDLQPKKPRQRCVDFPPYYYKALRKNNQTNKRLRVKISSSPLNEKFDERETTRSTTTAGRPLNYFLESIERSAIRTRLLDDRSYGNKEPYTAANVGKPPSLDDIATASTKTQLLDKLWISLPARLLTFAAAYLAFPYVSQVFNMFVTMKPDQLVSCVLSLTHIRKKRLLVVFRDSEESSIVHLYRFASRSLVSHPLAFSGRNYQQV